MLREKLEETPQTIAVERASETGEAVEELNPIYFSLSEALGVKDTGFTEKQSQLASTEKMITQMQSELERLQAEYTEKKAMRDRLVTRLELASNTYKLLSEKLVQTQIYQAVDLGQTHFLTIAAAEPPASPVKPRKELNIAIAAVLGLMAGLLLAFLLEMLDNSIPPNPAEMLSSRRMEKFLQDIRSRYDRVVIDTSPIGAVTDAIILSSLVDGVLLVINSGRTPVQMAQDAREKLLRSNAHIVGIILNKVRRDTGGYYHYYYYGKQQEEKL
jgi:hypothetical protein